MYIYSKSQYKWKPSSMVMTSPPPTFTSEKEAMEAGQVRNGVRHNLLL